MAELAELVISLTGSRSHIVRRPPAADDPRQRRPDISLADEVLDWRPTVPMKVGLGRTIEYFDALLSQRAPAVFP